MGGIKTWHNVLRNWISEFSIKNLKKYYLKNEFERF
jgi:hypothetical protein